MPLVEHHCEPLLLHQTAVERAVDTTIASLAEGDAISGQTNIPSIEIQ